MFTLARFERELDAVLAPLRRPVTTVARPGHGDGQPATHPPLCVALSGGLDSTVLLAALAQLRGRTGQSRWSLRAIHVDHSLHADAARWARAASDQAWRLDVPCTEIQVDARATPGASPEAAARTARYDALRAALHSGEVLLTAHHADDQLETILLQWLRGGGLRAVAGMVPLARFGPDAWHARPLLAFDRTDLEDWARAQGLAWVEDPSNADRRFDRNYLRHEILPPLRARWPAAAQTARRVAEFAREALALEASVVDQDLPPLLHGSALDLRGLGELPVPRSRAVVRAWLAGLGLPPPSARTLATMLHDMNVAASDRIPRTTWSGASVARYRERLYADAPRDTACHTGAWTEPACGRYAWTACESLELVADVGLGLSRAKLPAQLTVDRRQGGEQFVPAGGQHRRPLRKWLQERDVLPWRREHLPLLRDDAGCLVAVADLGCADAYSARPDEPSWRVVWHGRGIVTESDSREFRWPAHPPFG